MNTSTIPAQESKLIPAELIRRKRNGEELSAPEIHDFFEEFLRENVADYQVSAMLMAMFLNGMSLKETLALTKTSQSSGMTLEWPYPSEQVVDKHSTGGVGDKTSLVLLPLCVLAGLKMPMISGRGLGHTGGTLDKLESIPGMCPKLSLEEARKILERHGGVFMGQTEEIARLDKRLYALRDVTATVESIPLICASILSKKLAEGLGGLVLDVKFGSGAFIQEVSEAKKLAHLMVETANAAGVKTTALLTSMNSPLGTTAGNSVEVAECIEVLKGGGPPDTRSLSVKLAAELVLGAQKEPSSLEQIEAELEQHLQSGRAYEVFDEIVSAQGGRLNEFEQSCSKAQSELVSDEVLAPKNGFCNAIDVRSLGIALIELGGGRRRITDSIHPHVSLTDLVHVGDSISKGDPLVKITATDRSSLEKAKKILERSYKITDQAAREPLILERISHVG